MKMPMLEPADSQECKDFTKRAFELSEQFDTPFMLRTTVRVNHGSSIVTLEDRVEVPVKHYERDIMKNTNIPALAGTSTRPWRSGWCGCRSSPTRRT